MFEVRRRASVLMALALLAGACGPPELPSFARPPDPDAGPSSDEDSGSTDSP